MKLGFTSSILIKGFTSSNGHLAEYEGGEVRLSTTSTYFQRRFNEEFDGKTRLSYSTLPLLMVTMLPKLFCFSGDPTD